MEVVIFLYLSTVLYWCFQPYPQGALTFLQEPRPKKGRKMAKYHKTEEEYLARSRYKKGGERSGNKDFLSLNLHAQNMRRFNEKEKYKTGILATKLGGIFK